jgi:Ferredoxin thioredoxin reductase variable alpha chain
VLLAKEREQSMKIGDRVRVIASVVVYHHPEHKKQAFDIKDMQGEIVEIINDWRGRPISPNFPIIVQFEKKFRAHFRDDELEVI